MDNKETIKQFNNKHLPVLLVFVEKSQIVFRDLSGNKINREDVVNLLGEHYGG